MAFAAVAGIEPRHATRLMAAAVAGKPWKGNKLEVREVSESKGGRSGLTYEVSLRSLSKALERRATNPSEVAPGLPVIVPSGMEYDHLAALDAALDLPARSQERAAAVKAIAAASGVHEDTVRRHLAKVAEQGAVALLRKTPSNKNQRRVAINRAFTAAWIADGRVIGEAHALQDRLEALIAGMRCGQHANAGAGRIARDASHALKKWCAEAAFAPAGKIGRKVFEVPPRMAKRPRDNGALNRMNTDASEHYNKSPYRHSNLNQLLPMEVLMGDVHHMDWKTHRQDGEPAHCIKAIAWMCMRTRRVWVDAKRCAKGESVRKADVNASLASVFKHPEWGSPDHMWVDNGKEYALRDALTEPMRLAAEKAGVRAAVIHSIPHNARGKGLIEGWFGRIERGSVSLLPGYSGGDRMRAKTHNQGCEIEAFPASPEAAEAVIRQIVAAYNDEPQEVLDGLSPNEVYAAQRHERATVTWSVEALGYALADRDSRTNQKCQIQLNNRFYELHGRAMAAERVTVLHGPFIEGGVLVEYDGELTFAEEAPIFHPLDKEGARYSGRRRAEFNTAVRKLSHGLPAVNPLKDAIANHQPTIDLIDTPKGVVQLAISPKARRDNASRADAEMRALEDEKAEILKRTARGRQALPSKVA